MAGSSWTNQVVSLLIIQSAGNFQGLFVYSPKPGAGNLIGSWASQAGTDPYGNAYPQGLYATSITFNLSGGRLLIYSNVLTTTILTGAGNWTAPSTLVGGVTKAETWAGGGAGGSNGSSNGSGGGGGGAEYAAEPTLAITAGHTYAYSAGTGAPNSASNGNNSTFAGDSVTVTSHGGKSGVNGSGGFTNGAGGAGGTGSTNTVHHDGGAGSVGGVSNNGGGGGGAGGSTGAGGTATSATPGAGNDGGGSGGAGDSTQTSGAPGGTPGGGGGGGQFSNVAALDPGGAGANGQIKLTYTISNVLTSAIAPAAGTDTSGNAYAQGFTGQLTAFQPGSSPTVVETWHQITPLSNSWVASGSGVNGLFYRFLGSPPNTVQVVADISGGTGICATLPAGYQPTIASNYPGSAGATVSVASGGAITPSANCAFSILIPLDSAL